MLQYIRNQSKRFHTFVANRLSVILHPLLDEIGILRVGGRLENALIDYDAKHPIILPYRDHVTDLIISQHHQKTGHLGQEYVLSSLRHQYWVIKGRSAVRRVISGCFLYKKLGAVRGEQLMGEAWERIIRSIRKILKALLEQQLVTDEMLQTLMAEVAGILNSRPLTPVSSDPKDLEPLTPNHLLLLRSNPSLPVGSFGKEDSYSKRRWRQVQYISDIFWKRWLKEYLPTLQERAKWMKPRRSLEIGDLVLIADENVHRGKWPLGKVVDVFRGKDGYV